MCVLQNYSGDEFIARAISVDLAVDSEKLLRPRSYPHSVVFRTEGWTQTSWADFGEFRDCPAMKFLGNVTNKQLFERLVFGGGLRCPAAFGTLRVDEDSTFCSRHYSHEIQGLMRDSRPTISRPANSMNPRIPGVQSRGSGLCSVRKICVRGPPHHPIQSPRNLHKK